MSDLFYLILKCTVAAGIMAVIHFVSKTPNYYLSAIALGFPALSATAYYFMSIDRGNADVKTTTFFAIFTTLPFLLFLGTTNIVLKSNNIVLSLISGLAIWLICTIIVVILWKYFHGV